MLTFDRSVAIYGGVRGWLGTYLLADQTCAAEAEKRRASYLPRGRETERHPLATASMNGLMDFGGGGG